MSARRYEVGDQIQVTPRSQHDISGFWTIDGFHQSPSGNWIADLVATGGTLHGVVILNPERTAAARDGYTVELITEDSPLYLAEPDPAPSDTSGSAVTDHAPALPDAAPSNPPEPPLGDRILADMSLSDSEAFDAAREAYAPEHGPLAAPLSDRTLAKVLSRPAHVPSLVALDAAEHLADVATNALVALQSVGPWTAAGGGPTVVERLEQALDGFRAVTR